MAETKTPNDLVICKSELIALGGAIPVAVGIIVLRAGLGSRPVKDLTRIPDTASIVVAVSRGRTEYTLPGGKKDPSDLSLQYACRREIGEELGITAIDSLRFFSRGVAPAVSDPTVLVDVSAYHIQGFRGDIRQSGELDDVAVVPIFEDSTSIPLGGVVIDVLNRLQPAA
jgi:8-oxo-dGTP pyrophosphatase MutT (NUDIX family)